MNWQPIETAPTWVMVLVYDNTCIRTKSNKSQVHAAVKTEDGNWRFASVPINSPTHWMPLPPEPKE